MFFSPDVFSAFLFARIHYITLPTACGFRKQDRIGFAYCELRVECWELGCFFVVIFSRDYLRTFQLVLESNIGLEV